MAPVNCWVAQPLRRTGAMTARQRNACASCSRGWRPLGSHPVATCKARHPQARAGLRLRSAIAWERVTRLGPDLDQGIDDAGAADGYDGGHPENECFDFVSAAVGELHRSR